MGYIRHHALIVIGRDDHGIAIARSKALRIFDGYGDWMRLVSPLIKSVINGYASFYIAPDGSKEGWRDSDTGDRKRAEFVAWITSNRDILIGLSLVEVAGFGGDDHTPTVTEFGADMEEL